jgi:predicted PurR-regulated permease PerM
MNKKERNQGFLRSLALVVIGVVLYWGLTNYKVVEHWLSLAAEILSACVIGFVIALILNVPMSFIERNLFRPRKDGKRGRLSAKLARPISLLLTYLLCIGVVALVLALLIPSIKNTVMQLYEQVPDFVVRVFNLAKNNASLSEWIDKMDLSSDKVIKSLADKLHDTSFVADTLTGTFNAASGVVSGVTNFVIGIVFSVYMLAQKEKLKNQLYRICTAYLPEKLVKKLVHIGNLSKSTFSGFLSGQGLEACILGSLCALGMTVFGFPYAATIGVLVAVTAFIPIVGALIGVAVGALLIMITSLKKALLFVLFMIILQQIENNLIYPRVVGKSVGLPSMWVLFAITIGGKLGGILGMFVAVPVCSVIYCLLGDSVNSRNEKKRKAKEQSDSAEVPEWLKAEENYGTTE